MTIAGHHDNFSASVVHLPEIDSQEVQLRHFLFVGSFCYRGEFDVDSRSIIAPVLSACGAVTLKSSHGIASSNGVKILKEILELEMLSAMGESFEENVPFWVSFSLSPL